MDAPNRRIEFRQAADVAGVGRGSAIPCAGIRVGDILLAVIKYNAGIIAGLDVSRFRVLDGAVISDSVDTSAYRVHVVWVDDDTTREVLRGI